MKTTYYLILEKTVGKRESDENYYHDYLFKNGEWVPDTEWAIQDRLVGYDSTEPPGSPYGFGSMSIMDEIEEISEEEARRLIKKEPLS